MENNWRDRIEGLIHNNCTNFGNSAADLYEFKEIVEVVIKFGNLVFEATKKECADKVTLTEFASEFLQEGCNEAINKESILNINKPNL